MWKKVIIFYFAFISYNQTSCNQPSAIYTTKNVSSWLENLTSDNLHKSNLVHLNIFKNFTCVSLQKKNCYEGRGASKCLDSYQGTLKYDNSGCVDAILGCNCVTYKSNTDVVEVGKCMHNCKSNKHHLTGENIYTNLSTNIFEWNNTLCGPFNRFGTLCGKCQKGLHTKAYSFDISCVKCYNVLFNWFKYMMIGFGPLTFLCIFILATNMILPSTLLQGFVLYCQFITAPLFLRIALIAVKDYSSTYRALQALSVIYGVWNLDFFRAYNLDICLQTNSLTTLTLDLAIAFYPLFMILVTYFLVQLYEANFKPLVLVWKLFRHMFQKFTQKFKVQCSVSLVETFCTFMLLSSIKLLNVCFDILIPVNVLKISSPTNSTTSLRLYYDANIEYFSPQHLPYAIFAIVVLLTNILLPIVLLFFYPFTLFQRLLNKFPSRVQIVLRMFVDSFQGGYQDGVHSGSIDYRCLSVQPFVIRLFVYILYALLLDASFTIIAAVCCVIYFLIFLHFQPFKVEKFNFNTMIFALFLGSFCVCCTLSTSFHENKIEPIIYHTLAIIVCVSPLVYFIFHMCIRLLRTFYFKRTNNFFYNF